MERRRGFTLMEIMVVIIIIAVLSEIAGPMVAEMVEKSKITATIQGLDSLKKGLLRYKLDLGRLPHEGTTYTANNINLMGQNEMCATSTLLYFNPLVVNGKGLSTTSSWFYLNLLTAGVPHPYWNRWKGPYMDCDPEEFLFDAWEEPIRYLHYNKAVWLHSAGPDGEYESPTCFNATYTGDDIVSLVLKVKF
jgi:prepilin-type N-terminal cleavage/methylation domain-containing protein